MLDWLSGNNIPQFWKNYISLFDNDANKSAQRYVVFDMETTGTDFREDVIIAIGGLAVTDNKIIIGDFLEIAAKQDKVKTQLIATQQRLKNNEDEEYVEVEVLIQLLNFIKDATLVSHNINLDVEMINQALKRLDLGRLKNQVMDINVLYQKWKDLPDDYEATLDEMCRALKINNSERHTASGNAYTMAVIFLKLKRKLGL